MRAQQKEIASHSNEQTQTRAQQKEIASHSEEQTKMRAQQKEIASHTQIRKQKRKRCKCSLRVTLVQKIIPFSHTSNFTYCCN
ncbi:hypothetical protein MKX67_04350 [Cytobacillus sp. FSL W7-1323]|uniref:hypothetical protein n=1 Tax=unclassified Cytobacillus TaxID=2675268 RepID=UPI002AFE7810|nr:hypothetical protein [Cytobacillus sp. OWB-43]MEA1854522.1 hypothetical protein [Cytobacillus sp. OWB-43]